MSIFQPGNSKWSKDHTGILSFSIPFVKGWQVPPREGGERSHTQIHLHNHPVPSAFSDFSSSAPHPCLMDFNLLADTEARSPALSLSDSGTPQHEHSCKGQDHSGECEAQDAREVLTCPCGWIWVAGCWLLFSWEHAELLLVP